MKTLKFLAIILPMCVALVACGGKKNEPTNPTENQLKQEALNLAKFLTDNYTVGDRVFFITENDELVEFEVRRNEFAPLNVMIEPEEGEEEPEEGEGEFGMELKGFSMITMLRSAKTTFEVALTCLVENNKIYTDGTIKINAKSDMLPAYTEVDDENIIITIADKECILTKNIGVTNVSSGEHTWDLVTAK